MKAGCQHICEEKGEDAVCKCRDGFELSPNGKTCDQSKYFPCDDRVENRILSIIIIFIDTVK